MPMFIPEAVIPDMVDMLQEDGPISRETVEQRKIKVNVRALYREYLHLRLDIFLFNKHIFNNSCLFTVILY